MRRTLLAVIFIVFAQPAGAGFTEGQAHYLRSDYAGARAQWSAAAERGDPRACYGLGVLYWRGLGVAPDAVEAVRWFTQAARQGYRPASEALAAAFAVAAKWRLGGWDV